LFAAWRVAVVFTAANLTGGAFRGIVNSSQQAEKAISGNEAALKRMHAAAMTTLAAFGVVGVAAFMHIADAAGVYQTQMTLVQQQTGATTSQMVKLSSVIKDLSAGPGRTLFGMTDLVGGARGLQQSGIPIDLVAKLLPSVAYAGEMEKQRQGSLNLANFASQLGSTIMGYKLTEQQALKFADLYTRVASTSHITASGMLAYENQAGMFTRQSGWTFQDFLTNMGFMSQMGIKPQMIGTMLKNVLTNSTPRANLTGHAATAQFRGLELMHMLTPADPAAAKKYLEFMQGAERSMHLPITDPAKMTAAQQENLAGGLMRYSVLNKATGMRGTMVMLHTALLNYQKTFGKRSGDEKFLTDVRNVGNLRGGPQLLAYAQAGGAGYDEYVKSLKKQTDLTTRASTIRTQLHPMQQMLPQMLNTLAVQFGGAAPGGVGPPIPGGPLDVMTRIMGGITGLLGQLSAWANLNPIVAARIGTFVGILGVVGLVGAAVMATGSVLSLVGSLRILATAAKGAAVSTDVEAVAANAFKHDAGWWGIGGSGKHIADEAGLLAKFGAGLVTVTGYLGLLAAALAALILGFKWFNDHFGIHRQPNTPLTPKEHAAAIKAYLPVTPPMHYARPNAAYKTQPNGDASPFYANTTAGHGRNSGIPSTVSLTANFHGITDQKEMMKKLEDYVNKNLRFLGNRQGGVAANPWTPASVPQF
jgi:hypothetical protein